MKSEIVRIQAFSEGEVVFRQGDQSGAAYLVREGQIQVGKTGEGGTVHVVGYAGPGQIFGEDALLAEGDRPTSALATKPSKCVAIDRGKLMKTLKAQDPFISALFGILANNMQSMIDKGADLDCLLEDLSGDEDGAQSFKQAVDRKPGAAPSPGAKSAPAAPPSDDEDDDAFLI